MNNRIVVAAALLLAIPAICGCDGTGGMGGQGIAITASQGSTISNVTITIHDGGTVLPGFPGITQTQEQTNGSKTD